MTHSINRVIKVSKGTRSAAASATSPTGSSSSLTSHDTKVAQAQAELRACESYLAEKERDTEVAWTRAMRDGLRARAAALVQYGVSCADRGRHALQQLDSASGHPGALKLDSQSIPLSLTAPRVFCSSASFRTSLLPCRHLPIVLQPMPNPFRTTPTRHTTVMRLLTRARVLSTLRLPCRSRGILNDCPCHPPCFRTELCLHTCRIRHPLRSRNRSMVPAPSRTLRVSTVHCRLLRLVLITLRSLRLNQPLKSTAYRAQPIRRSICHANHRPNAATSPAFLVRRQHHTCTCIRVSRGRA